MENFLSETTICAAQVGQWLTEDRDLWDTVQHGLSLITSFSGVGAFLLTDAGLYQSTIPTISLMTLHNL